MWNYMDILLKLFVLVECLRTVALSYHSHPSVLYVFCPQTPRGLPPRPHSQPHRPSTADHTQPQPPRTDSRGGLRGGGGGGAGGVSSGNGNGNGNGSGAVVGTGGYSALESARRVAALPSASAAPASFLQV